MNWKNDPNLSSMSDFDYLTQVAQSLTDAIHANPDDARAWFLRGNAYLDRGQYEFAASDYSKVIELTPDDAVAYNNRGIAHRNSGFTDLAVSDYTKALGLDPNYRDAHNNLGMALSDIADLRCCHSALHPRHRARSRLLVRLQQPRNGSLGGGPPRRRNRGTTSAPSSSQHHHPSDFSITCATSNAAKEHKSSLKFA